LSDQLGVLADRIRAARRLTILTGAGISAASGVPTFRGEDGLWRRHRAEDLATPEAFERNPRLVWEWYDWRRGKLAGCRPNAGHHVIAAWSGSDPGDGSYRGRTLVTDRLKVVVITQNVDDLHVRAGTRNLIRIHGSIWELSCWDTCAKGAAGWRDERVPLDDLPPRCPHCGGFARPAVVWFGEALRTDHLRVALEATACDVFLTVGTSAVVYPAAGLVHDARRQGAFTAEINLEATPASAAVDVALQGGAEVILPRLAELARL